PASVVPSNRHRPSLLLTTQPDDARLAYVAAHDAPSIYHQASLVRHLLVVHAAVIGHDHHRVRPAERGVRQFHAPEREVPEGRVSVVPDHWAVRVVVRHLRAKLLEHPDDLERRALPQ